MDRRDELFPPQSGPQLRRAQRSVTNNDKRNKENLSGHSRDNRAGTEDGVCRISGTGTKGREL